MPGRGILGPKVCELVEGGAKEDDREGDGGGIVRLRVARGFGVWAAFWKTSVCIGCGTEEGAMGTIGGR